MIDPAAISLPRLRWSADEGFSEGERLTAEEAAIAIVHDASTTAVMMATPADLEDLAIGFSLSEGVIEQIDEIQRLELAPSEQGIEVRLWLASDRSARLAARRRRLAGATGCGLCGVDSLAEALRPPLRIQERGVTASVGALLAAMEQLSEAQSLGRSTRAVHAAALWRPGEALIVREDVGRHNALDKLIGAVRRAGASDEGVLLLTSRVSVEMVQKAAVLGAPILCAVSAPTSLAVRTAAQAGLTLVAVARSDGLEVFTRSDRILPR